MTFLTGPLPMIPQAGAARDAGGKDGSPAVVALGGGHGLSASLSALRLLTTDLTAVVTVADDGGSSGRLRHELDVLPPGDLRMALAALCDDTDWGRTWRDVMQHRFQSRPGVKGSLDNHALGNLLIVTLWELLGDPVAGLQWAGALLGARGQVLPMSTQPLTIEGDVLRRTASGEYLELVTGQARLATAGARGKVTGVRLTPADAVACPEAVTAIERADWVILGPGSWYTSVLPHLMLPELRSALCRTKAKRCLTMNLSNETKETAGMSALDHLAEVQRYAPGFRVDAVLVDPAVIEDPEAFGEAVAKMGGRPVFGKVGAATGRPIHDPLRLATAYHDMFGEN
ncbi:uridine diphosphate-N-acetylglucosamine-binding protein YvcK [Arthrobacter sp. zg-Y820]|uniref:gluconeogenesis factor YvcK family protein n=1 Tax=unclassified Arthrobacter TaxID=235627 RepID=UPI001E5DA41D|nr:MULTISPECIES: uridine diphosphate-N-acetylglucosamine-binding protein YvcK [unclassified Arthrobacter]MCC9196608.1 uridine diphosphate-N-acetylglucosamine-binding protein YvcK [Arthrobacter sp. zg-Y820]MDK1279470.1 uridine diphosphate-N-acetylglucosamine-binding protein YvcK [Arthrobacter sp. zg.Y820]MDK1358911.1 uridine diphosphate-N-acetylglucosamine-binding protein YvcK [Arthrobacter sp. zg-Y1219]WIB08152.1 uridine diphosphate-N-acetylglucosamine-binding protein YvcK [Arthrobacter sp. zg-